MSNRPLTRTITSVTDCDGSGSLSRNLYDVRFGFAYDVNSAGNIFLVAAELAVFAEPVVLHEPANRRVAGNDSQLEPLSVLDNSRRTELRDALTASQHLNDRHRLQLSELHINVTHLNTLASVQR